MPRALRPSLAIPWLAAVLLGAGALSGCMSFTEQLEKNLNKGRHDLVVDQGMAQLRASTVPPEERVAIRTLVAKAAFKRARLLHTPPAYQRFLNLVEGWPEAKRLRVKAALLEAEAAYRDTKREGTRAAFRAFRKRYPTSRQAPEAHQREAAIAYREAKTQDTLEGWHAFRSEYASAGVDSERMEFALRRESEIAFLLLAESPSVAKLEVFRTTYPEFHRPQDLHHLERQITFEETLKENTLEGYVRFRERFEEDWEARHQLMEMRMLELALVQAALLETPSLEQCATFLDTYSKWPEVAEWIGALHRQCALLELEGLITAEDTEGLRTFITTHEGNYASIDLIDLVDEAQMALLRLDPGPEQERVRLWLEDSRQIETIYVLFATHLPDSRDSSAQKKERERRLGRALSKANRRLRNKPLELHAVRILDVTPETALTSYGKKKVRSALQRLKRKSGVARDWLGLGKGQEPNLLTALMLVPTLLSCNRCMHETGKFEVQYEIPVPTHVYGHHHVFQEYSEHDEEPSYPEYASYGDGACAAPDEAQWMQTDEHSEPLVIGEMPEDYNPEMGPPWTSPELLEVSITRVIGSRKKALALTRGSIVPLTGKIRELGWRTRTLHLKLR